jgi:hypothetical protein
MRFRKRDRKPSVIESRFELMLLQPPVQRAGQRSSTHTACINHRLHPPPPAVSAATACRSQTPFATSQSQNPIPSHRQQPGQQTSSTPLHVPGAWVGDVAQPEGCVSLLTPPMHCTVAMPLTVRLLCGRRTLKGSLTARFPVAQSAGLRPWTSLRSPHGARPYGVEVPDLPVCV